MRALQCDVCGKYVSEGGAGKWVHIKASTQKEKSEYISFVTREIDLCYDCAVKTLPAPIHPYLLAERI